MNKNIKFSYSGNRADVGGMTVYRMLPNKQVGMVGPFVFLDYIPRFEVKPKKPQLPNGKGAHPHRGIATFTYVLDGELEHFDSRGNHGVVGKGGAQWMNAGNGIVHDENLSQNFQQSGGSHLGMQFWINLPSVIKKEQPGYMGLQDTEFPKLELQGGTGHLKVLIGTYEGLTSPITTYTTQFAYHLHLHTGKEFNVEISSTMECAALIADGAVAVNDTSYEQKELVIFGSNGSALVFKNNTDKPVDIILFGGEPYTEPVVSYGPFVMNTQEEIKIAYDDYQKGKYKEINYTS